MKAELFELLFRTLHHNWRYFFKSTVLASVQRGIAEEQMDNEPQFSAIMQVRGKALPVILQCAESKLAFFWVLSASLAHVRQVLLAMWPISSLVLQHVWGRH